jgi:hypothetical protein
VKFVTKNHPDILSNAGHLRIGNNPYSMATVSPNFALILCKGLSDSAVESRHGIEMEISNGYPRDVVLSAKGVVKKDVKGQFEMGEGVVKEQMGGHGDELVAGFRLQIGTTKDGEIAVVSKISEPSYPGDAFFDRFVQFFVRSNQRDALCFRQTQIARVINTPPIGPTVMKNLGVEIDKISHRYFQVHEAFDRDWNLLLPDPCSLLCNHQPIRQFIFQ